jgi:hypothetical protein
MERPGTASLGLFYKDGRGKRAGLINLSKVTQARLQSA